MVSKPTNIVISGAGLATSLGVGREASWAALREGKIGLGPYTAIEDPAQAPRGGGEVPTPPGSVSKETPSHAAACEQNTAPTSTQTSEKISGGGDGGGDGGGPRESAYLRLAIDEALRHAGLDPEAPESWPYAPERCGIMLGTTLHGMTAAGKMVRQNSAWPLQDFLAPAVVAKATTHLPLEGFAATTCSACSSGLGSILLAETLLRSGQLDLVIAGGYDPISEYAYAGFNSLRLIDERMPRPFARDRAGMKVSEGYAIVTVERGDDLKQRGHAPFIYLRGGGESADAHHLTQPMQDGSGAARAITTAMRQADTSPAEVDLIVAHATGTPDNDAAEVAALSSIFGGEMPNTPVVGLKSRLGHTLGAAGAAEMIFAGLAMRDQTLPTTATTTAHDIDFEDFQLADGPARPAAIHTTINTSLGFGGANTCVVVSSKPGKPQTTTPPQEVWITGIGVVTPPPGSIPGSTPGSAPGSLSDKGGGSKNNVAAVNQAFAAHVAEGLPAVGGPVAEDNYLHLLSARRVRRLSDYVKLTLAAASVAFEDAQVPEDQRDAFTADCPAILGTTHGSTHYSYDYYRGIVDDGLATANPMLFAEGVPNAGAAHLSMSLKLRGACQSIIGSRTAGLDALRLASLRIAGGQCERAFVCAGEEHDELIERCYAELGLPMTTCGAAVTLVLESRASAEARGARCRGVVESGTQINFNRRVLRGVRQLDRLLQKEAQAGVSHVINSANGTWLDRVEAAALRRQPGLTVSSLRGSLAECFSAGPLAAVAATLLNGRPSGPAGEKPTRVAVLASDFNGLVSLARIRLPHDLQ